MRIARSRHRATLLKDGRVLVAGGSTKWRSYYTDSFHDIPTAETEIYDPELGTWTSTAPMAEVRGGGFAQLVLLDGRVLVIGGPFTDLSGGVASGALSTAEVYDPAKNEWHSAGAMSRLRTSLGNSIVLADGRVLVAGGSTLEATGQGTPLSTAELYDPTTNQWSFAAPMVAPVYAPTLFVLSTGEVLLIGQEVGEPFDVLSAQRHDPSADRWSRAAFLQGVYPGYAFVELTTSQLLMTSDVGCFISDGGSDQWAPATCPPLPNSAKRVALTGGDLLWVSISTCPGSDRSQTLLYVRSEDTWLNVGTTLACRSGFSLTPLANGQVLLTGGDGNRIDDPQDPWWMEATNTTEIWRRR